MRARVVTGRPRVRGASAIEFALALPLLVVLIAAVLDYGWYFFTETMAVHAVREAARQGAMLAETSDPNGADVAAEVIADAMAEAGVDCTEGAGGCVVTTSYTGPAGGRLLGIEVRVEFHGLTGIVPVPEAILTRASAFLEGQSDAGDRTDCADGASGCSGAPVMGTRSTTGGGSQTSDTGG
ncbi:MAG: TadE family protein [Myxococcota bacterium]